MADEIRRLTELLARDPGNIAFRQLAELLRQRGDLDSAQRVAVRGLERHTLDAEAHALLARISLDRGELQRAFDEWDMALRLSPKHLAALKGLGFISYRWGRLDDAERYLVEATSVAGNDGSVTGALESVRNAKASLSNFPGVKREDLAYQAQNALAAPGGQAISGRSQAATATDANNNLVNDTRADSVDRLHAIRNEWSQAGLPDESDPRELFRSVVGDADLQALLVDPDGLVIAGKFRSSDGADRAQDVAAQLSGVSDEANRAMRHLQLGEWKSISFESDRAVVAMSKAGSGGDALVVVASSSSAPLGLLKRVLDRAQRKAGTWLDGES